MDYVDYPDTDPEGSFDQRETYQGSVLHFYLLGHLDL
jgi:hypothetical protein